MRNSLTHIHLDFIVIQDTCMDSRFEIRDISLSSARAKGMAEALLASAGLLLDSALESMVGIFDQDDMIKGCAGLDGDVIKCMALSDDLRGEGIAGSLVTELMNRAYASGHTNVRVFTKPEYESLFADMGFSLCGRSRRAVMMESDSAALKRYKSYLSTLDCDAVIVANANPCTLGHLYLIAQAAASSRRLAVIPVAEHSSNMFTYRERVDMLRAAVSHIPGVVIAEGSDYAVSAATFPSYFIKEASAVAEAQAELDLDIFCRHLAPSLGATVRFVGTEPADMLTASYNKVMQRVLPAHGIRVVEIDRKQADETVISASLVRKYLAYGHLREALAMVPSSDLPCFFAYLAIRALKMELELAPKPGLVDPFDNGSHKDMDFALMMKGIGSLRPYFRELACEAMSNPGMTPHHLKEIGLRGEALMFKATGGVNTHKGAVFALGLAVAAAARIICGHTHRNLSQEIASLASGLHYASGTHGEKIRNENGLPGAMDYARAGYPDLFRSWIPYLESEEDSVEHRLRLMLKIMTEIDDSNACYRAGVEKAAQAKQRAREILDAFSIEKLHELNEDFKICNMSHGGAADMLSLTFFVASVLPACEAALSGETVIDIENS